MVVKKLKKNGGGSCKWGKRLGFNVKGGRRGGGKKRIKIVKETDGEKRGKYAASHQKNAASGA